LGRNRFLRFEQTLIALGLSQKLLAFRTRLIFFGRLKFAGDDLVQLVDGPMRYRLPAHGPIKTPILVLDQSTPVPYFYGFDHCFLRVRSFGITHWLVRAFRVRRLGTSPSSMRAGGNLLKRLNVIPPVQSPFAKIFHFARRANHPKVYPALPAKIF
jgi:hypothetical protein